MSKAKKPNVRVDLEREVNSEPPYIYSPYPENIIQIRAGETRGEMEVVELINENWPATINELEEIAEEEYGGYSGSFIRSVLRSKYIPADLLEPAENGTMEQAEYAPKSDSPEDDEWHRLFRLGLRCGIEYEDITEDDAFEAFGSGFVEGRKLKEEMGL